jgi:hypothetical protein
MCCAGDATRSGITPTGKGSPDGSVSFCLGFTPSPQDAVYAELERSFVPRVSLVALYGQRASTRNPARHGPAGDLRNPGTDSGAVPRCPTPAPSPRPRVMEVPSATALTASPRGFPPLWTDDGHPSRSTSRMDTAVNRGSRHTAISTFAPEPSADQVGRPTRSRPPSHEAGVLSRWKSPSRTHGSSAT